MTQCIHHPSIPLNIRDIQIPNIVNGTIDTNIPIQAQEKESRPPPSSDFYESLNFFRHKSSTEEEKVEEGMEVPYVNGIQSTATMLPKIYDPYNSGIVAPDDTDGSSNMNSINFCNPVAGIVSAVLAVGNDKATSTSSGDAQDDGDIISVEESESDNSSTSDNYSKSIDVKATPSSLLYSTSIMDDDGTDDYGDVYDDEDPIVTFNNNADNNNMMHHGRSANDATVKYSNTATRIDDTNVDNVIIQRDTDAIELPNVSLLDADTTTVHDETSASNFDLGSLEPSTIVVKGSFMTENEEYDVNGDESILDAEVSSQPLAPPPSIQHQIEIIEETSVKAQGNTLISSATLPNSTQLPGPAKEADSVQIVESKKIKRFELPKPNRLFNMCLKPLHLQQYHGKHQQRGYRYLEDIEMDSLFQPIIMSPPLEILAVRTGSTNDTNKRIERDASSNKQQHQSENQNQLSALEKHEEGNLYNEWNELQNRTTQTYADEPEPYLEFSDDEEVSDDDNNNESEDVRRSIDGDDAIPSLDHIKIDAVKKPRSKNSANRSRRRRQNHSSNRSVASSTTNLSLLTATIAEETPEDLHDDSDDDSFLNSSIVPLVRSRSDPNLARYYSTKTTNNQIYDDIHMTGIHHYRSAQIFPQSNGSSASPNFRRNSQHQHYRALENDSRQGSASLLPIQRRRQHQLRYNNKNLRLLSSARSVPNEKSHRLTNKSFVNRKTPMFRSERASLGIHNLTNDEPSTSSSSNTSGDSQNVIKHNGTELLPSQKARMARFHRIQHQKHMHSLNSSTSSHVAEKGISKDHIAQTQRLVNDEKNTNHSPIQQHDKKDKNETTLSTTPDESIDIDDGTDMNHKDEVLALGDGDQIINYDHHRLSENPADVSFDSYSTNSSGMNNENDTSYMIDLLDVQLAELNRPDGALIGPDEASM